MSFTFDVSVYNIDSISTKSLLCRMTSFVIILPESTAVDGLEALRLEAGVIADRLTTFLFALVFLAPLCAHALECFLSIARPHLSVTLVR